MTSITLLLLMMKQAWPQNQVRQRLRSSTSCIKRPTRRLWLSSTVWCSASRYWSGDLNGALYRCRQRQLDEQATWDVICSQDPLSISLKQQSWPIDYKRFVPLKLGRRSSLGKYRSSAITSLYRSTWLNLFFTTAKECTRRCQLQDWQGWVCFQYWIKNGSVSPLFQDYGRDWCWFRLFIPMVKTRVFSIFERSQKSWRGNLESYD